MSADPRLSHQSRVVSELVERLSNAVHGPDEDAEFLGLQLDSAAQGLEALCLAALREAREAEAHAEALKSIIADNKARKDRLETKAEKIRAAVAQAMAEAGLPKITAPDLTVSFRANKPSIAFACEPDLTIVDQYGGFIKMKEVYSWDKEAVLEWLDAGNTLSFAKLTNAAPSLTLRSK